MEDGWGAVWVGLTCYSVRTPPPPRRISTYNDPRAGLNMCGGECEQSFANGVGKGRLTGSVDFHQRFRP
jgi:hypothetical protein